MTRLLPPLLFLACTAADARPRESGYAVWLEPAWARQHGVEWQGAQAMWQEGLGVGFHWATSKADCDAPGPPVITVHAGWQPDWIVATTKPYGVRCWDVRVSTRLLNWNERDQVKLLTHELGHVIAGGGHPCQTTDKAKCAAILNMYFDTSDYCFADVDVAWVLQRTGRKLRKACIP